MVRSFNYLSNGILSRPETPGKRFRNDSDRCRLIARRVSIGKITSSHNWYVERFKKICRHGIYRNHQPAARGLPSDSHIVQIFSFEGWKLRKTGRLHTRDAPYSLLNCATKRRVVRSRADPNRYYMFGFESGTSSENCVLCADTDGRGGKEHKACRHLPGNQKVQCARVALDGNKDTRLSLNRIRKIQPQQLQDWCLTGCATSP